MDSFYPTYNVYVTPRHPCKKKGKNPNVWRPVLLGVYVYSYPENTCPKYTEGGVEICIPPYVGSMTQDPVPRGQKHGLVLLPAPASS